MYKYFIRGMNDSVDYSNTYEMYRNRPKASELRGIKERLLVKNFGELTKDNQTMYYLTERKIDKWK